MIEGYGKQWEPQKNKRFKRGTNSGEVQSLGGGSAFFQRLCLSL